MLTSIDTEVDPRTEKVADYGAVRDDGAVLHTHSWADFDAFVSKCDFVCGHNIINHDLKYTALTGHPTIVDTLFLSPYAVCLVNMILTKPEEKSDNPV